MISSNTGDVEAVKFVQNQLEDKELNIADIKDVLKRFNRLLHNKVDSGYKVITEATPRG